MIMPLLLLWLVNPHMPQLSVCSLISTQPRTCGIDPRPDIGCTSCSAGVPRMSLAPASVRYLLSNHRGKIAILAELHDNVDRRRLSVDDAVLGTLKTSTS
jgi:hypothetical protein